MDALPNSWFSFFRRFPFILSLEVSAVNNIKQQALLAMARAYYDRGVCLQYDQRSMDRVLELTPRRRKRLPPEAANRFCFWTVPVLPARFITTPLATCRPRT